MSQQGILSDSTSAAADIETITTDDTNVVVPDAAFNVNVFGDVNQGLSTRGNIANTVTITDITVNENTLRTTDAAVTNAVTINLGIAGQYTVHIMVSAYEPATNLGCSFVNYGSIKTDAVASTEVATEAQLVENKDVALNTCDILFIANANTAVVQVQGVAGRTIDWRVWTKYVRT